MDAYVNSVARYLFAQSWQIAVMGGVVGLISLALRNRSAHIRYLLWLIVLTKCLVPPYLTIPLAVLPERSFTEHSTHPALSEIPVGDVIATDTVEAMKVKQVLRPPQTKYAVPNAREAMVVTWLAVVFLFLLWVCTRAVRYTLWLRRRRTPLPPDMHQSFQELFAGFKLKKSPRIWLTKDIAQPFVWGLLRGSIYVPTEFVDLDGPQRHRSVLAHELSHTVRFDAGVNVLQVLAQAIYWFHPFVWWINRKIRQEREKCCDEMAVAHLGAPPEHYTGAIVDTLVAERRSARPISSLAIVGSIKDIEERIKTMLRPGKKFYKGPSLMAATVVLLIAFLTVPTALVLTARAETDVTNEQEQKPAKSLHQAADNGDIELVMKLIAEGANVNATEKVGPDQQVEVTPLINAASGGHTQVVKLLLEHGAEVDATCSFGYTALYYAIWSAGINDVEGSIKVLIANGADVNKYPQEDGYSPLIHAIWMFREKEDIVKALLDAGAKIDFKDKDGLTPLFWAAFSSDKDVLDLILARGNYDNTIHLAAYRGNLSWVKKFVEEGTDVNIGDEYGCTPLHWAALAESTEVADFLIDEGADVNAKGAVDLTPLLAARGFPMIKLLVSKGADIQAQTRFDRMTKLHMVCREKDKATVEFLINKGAQVDQENRRGQTPLWLASSYGRRDIVELLIDKGADVNVSERRRGSTPLFIAARNDHKVVVELLITKGADVNKRSRDGFAPLHIASSKGHIETTKLLLEKGADVNAKRDNGDTPLSLAEKAGHTEIVELLRKHGAKE